VCLDIYRHKYTMKVKEIIENHAANRHLGLGKERAQDQRIMEKPRQQRREKRLKDNAAFGLGNQTVGGNWAASGSQQGQM